MVTTISIQKEKSLCIYEIDLIHKV